MNGPGNANKDVHYWDEYYGENRAPKLPSDFAKFALEYMQRGKTLIDLGCGNGRDSDFFCQSGLKVTALDSSKSAIKSFSKSMSIFAVCDDFVRTNILRCIDFDYCYARWSIHAINQAQQNELLPNIYGSLKCGGMFFSESRTTNDVKYGQGKALGEHEYFTEGHYRRFLDPDAFIAQLKEIGFEIVYCKESDMFSVMGDDSPTLIRVISKKTRD
jgi:cyclopropane fatty-acyl-phospholipid synthase-like methyltransferase